MPCSEKKGFAGIFLLFLICLVFLPGFPPLRSMAAAQDPPGPVKEISVAVGQDAAPFYFRDQKGVADGWLVNLWRLWSEKTGIKVKFVLAPFGETLKLTKEGKVDVQGGCFFSEVRAKYLGYVAPLIKADTHFFFHKNIYGIESLKDLLGFRIGVIKGDFAVDYLRNNLPGAALAEYVNNGDLFKAVEQGEIRVFVIDTPVGLYFLKKMRLLSNFRYYPDKPLYSNAFQAAVKKGDTVLPPVIKSGFAMISPEEKTQIERRWVGSKQIKTKGVLSIACDRYFPPFTMLNPSGQAAGILIDLWRLWSSKNFRRVEFVFGDWKDSVRMVKDGRADFHSGLYKTPEREAFLSFSDPVFEVQDSLAFKTNFKPRMLPELSGDRVGVLAGSGEESQLREQYPEIILIPYEGYKELVTGLRDGEVIAVFDLGVTLQRVIEDLGLQGEIRVFREATPMRNLLAGVAKKDAIRLKSINSGFTEISEKEIREIEARWVSNPDLQQYSGKARPMVLTFEEKQWLKEHLRIRLGVDSNFMPFEALSSGGEYEGISSSYVSLIARKLGVDMDPVKDLSRQDVIEAVKVGDLDALPCVAKSPARMDFLSFTRPYLDFQTVVVTRKDAPFIADLKGLKDARVAVVEGYFVHDKLKQDFPKMKLVPVKNIDQGLKAVAEGEAAAYVDNSASIIYAIRKLGLKDLKVAATTRYNSSLCFGVRKDWPQLATILDKALQSIPEIEREKIANRWINVRYAERTDWALLIKVGIAALVVIGLILAIILFWNRRLSREVGERKRAEERFQAIAATTPGAIIQVRFDAEGRPEYLYLSAKAEAFFGMPPEQVIQEKKRLNWHPEDQQRIKEEILNSLAAEEDQNLVGRIQPADGGVRWVHVNAAAGRSPDGGLNYNGFILDITERKLAEQEYLKSERKIKAMGQAAEDAMVMIDREGKVLFWNPAAEKLFGFSEAEAMGMDFHQMAAPGVYHDKIYKGLEHFAKTGEGPVLGTTTEISARNQKGREFPVEVTLSSFQVDDEWFAVGTVRDISERKKAEDALRKSERQVKTILETANEGFLLLNNEQETTDLNPEMCKILGRERDDAIGKTIFDFVDQENKKIFQEQIELRKRGITSAYEIALSRPDGSHVVCIFNSTPLFDENNEKMGAFAMVTDITERKNAGDRLEFTQTTVDKAALNIFWVDPETGAFTYANEAACKSLSYTREELLGMYVPQIDTAFNEENFAGLMEALQTHPHIETEGIHHTKDGRPINVLLSIVLTQLKDRRIIAVFARDITDQLKAENDLKQKLEELEQFNLLVVGREEKMIGLKEEINDLLVKLGREEKYEIVE